VFAWELSRLEFSVNSNRKTLFQTPKQAVLFQRTLVVVILPIALQWATVNCHSVASLP